MTRDRKARVFRSRPFAVFRNLKLIDTEALHLLNLIDHKLTGQFDPPLPASLAVVIDDAATKAFSFRPVGVSEAIEQALRNEILSSPRHGGRIC